MRKIKLRLIVNVEYKVPVGASRKEVLYDMKHRLLQIPNDAAGRGLFTEETEVEVNDWDSSCEEVK